jgi:hypothetical protein
MESLALLVVIIFAIALLSPIIALLLTFLHPKTPILNIIKKITQALFIALSLALGISFFINPSPNLAPLGLYAVILSYLTLRREYFPHIKILKSLLKKIKRV